MTVHGTARDAGAGRVGGLEMDIGVEIGQRVEQYAAGRVAGEISRGPVISAPYGSFGSHEVRGVWRGDDCLNEIELRGRETQAHGHREEIDSAGVEREIGSAGVQTARR